MTNTIINPEDDIPIDMSKSQPKLQISWQIIFTVSMFLFMYLPIFVLTFYSFNKSKYSSGWEGFTLQWYVKLFQDIRILVALQNSLTVAFFAVAIAAVIGTLMAVGLAKYKFRAAHIVFCLAYIGLVVSTRLADLDPNLEEAALDLGATPVEAFIKVLLPQLLPGIVSGCLLAFVLSMDDFLIASFTSGSGVTTLPMEIFSRIRTGVKPDINALSVILIIGSGGIGIVGELLRNRSEKKNKGFV